MQVIPTDTPTVQLQIAGPATQSLSLTRASGASTATASATLPEGTYQLSASAYNSAGQTTAQGTASAQVISDQVGQASLTLDGLYAPSLTWYQTSAGPGAWIPLYGGNFAYAGTSNGVPATPFEVFFGATQASTPSVDSDGVAYVQVPVSVSGNLQVIADGVPSSGSYPFAVINKIAFSPATTSVALYQSSGPATASLSLQVLDTSGNPVTNPYVYWSATGGGSGTTVAGGPTLSLSPATGSSAVASISGTVSSQASGTITISSGNVSTSIPYVLNP